MQQAADGCCGLAGPIGQKWRDSLKFTRGRMGCLGIEWDISSNQGDFRVFSGKPLGGPPVGHAPSFTKNQFLRSQATPKLASSILPAFGSPCAGI